MKNLFELLTPHVLFKVLTLILFSASPFKVSANVGAFLGQIAASSTGSFTTTYVPQFIGFTAATVPTNFQIEIGGESMIFSLDGNGLNSMTHIRQFTRVANTYVFQIADGLLNGKNAVFTIANAVAGVLSIYGWSPVKTGKSYYRYSKVPVLAGQEVAVTDFAYAAFPSMAATDRAAVAFRDKSVDNVGRDEINYHLGFTQGNLASQYNIDNFEAKISKVLYTGTAAQTGYKLDYVRA